MKRRFLVVSPHPDDAELAIGGTIIKLRQKGYKVFMIDLTSGEPTPYGTEERRKKETFRATNILQIAGRKNLGLTNRYLFDTKVARLLLAEQIRLFRPDVILCPSSQDAHPDHIATSKITEAARFYAKYSKLKLKGKFHYAGHILYYFASHLRAVPQFSFCVDISEQFKEKIKAIKCYRSQFIDNPKNRIIFEYIELQNRYLGKLVHCEYAEAIYSHEAIKIDDLSTLL
jgi:bacillithiol biosynthesis deacetylase BshB1